MKNALAAALVAASTLAAPASAALLTTGAGDGGVSIEVSAAGIASGTGDYDPIGPGGPASTIYLSDVLFRYGTETARQSVRFGAVQSSAMVDGAFVSTLSFGGGLDVIVTQTLSSLFADDGVTRTGSLLEQRYDFANATGSDIVLDLVRYLDGDLYFDGSLEDGGGVLDVGGRRILFETDNVANASDTDTFVGIYNEGGVAGSYDIDYYSTLLNRIRDGGDLTNGVVNDGNGDRFVDQRYDLGLAQQTSLAVANGGRGRFSTFTLFGTGAPNAVEVPGAVPEPATWAMMIGGFGLVGGAMRRRGRTTIVTA